MELVDILLGYHGVGYAWMAWTAMGFVMLGAGLLALAYGDYE